MSVNLRHHPSTQSVARPLRQSVNDYLISINQMSVLKTYPSFLTAMVELLETNGETLGDEAFGISEQYDDGRYVFPTFVGMQVVGGRAWIVAGDEVCTEAIYEVTLNHNNKLAWVIDDRPHIC